MALPEVPVLFMKPSTALADPFPAPTVIPRAFVDDKAADYESELVVVIGKAAKNVSEEEALDYVLGCAQLPSLRALPRAHAHAKPAARSYTAANDVSSRRAQFAQSQWCYSKSFDGACPVGPALVNKDQVKSIADLKIRGSLNGNTVQESGLECVIAS